MLFISVVGLINCLIFTVSFISANKMRMIYKDVDTGKKEDCEMSTSLKETENKTDRQIMVDQEEIMTKIKKMNIEKFSPKKS